MANELESGFLALVGRKLALEVLVPTAKVAGKQLKALTLAGLAHLHRLMERADRRRRDLRIRSGKISPRLLPALLEHAFVSLSSNDLCMQGIRPSLKTDRHAQFRSMHPTIRGAELYCWANGFGQKGRAEYFADRKPSEEAKAVALKPAKLSFGLVNHMPG